MFKGLNPIMNSISAGIQRPFQLKSLPLWVLTGLFDFRAMWSYISESNIGSFE
jgi:hypothetical protein